MDILIHLHYISQYGTKEVSTNAEASLDLPDGTSTAQSDRPVRDLVGLDPEC
jgi:hypothetical protein